MTMPEAYCVCEGPPWLPMISLRVEDPHRWYVCPRCGIVRQEMYQPGRGTASVIYHDLDGGTLSKIVIDTAQGVLEQVGGSGSHGM